MFKRLKEELAVIGNTAFLLACGIGAAIAGTDGYQAAVYAADSASAWHKAVAGGPQLFNATVLIFAGFYSQLRRRQ